MIDDLKCHFEGATGMKLCYFTATGNSLYVARRIGGGDAELLSIPQLMKEDRIEVCDEAVGIVFPVYVGGLPKMVRRFLDRADIRAGYLFAVCTFGSGMGLAADQVEDICRERGWDLAYSAGVLMADNYLPLFEMREQVETLPSKDVEGQVAAICADIAARKEQLTHASAKMRAMMAMSSGLSKRVLRGDAGRDYVVTDACTRCGTCARVCPAGNIAVTESGVSFSEACEVCYACLHACPANALHLRKERSAARFRNEHVTLADIMESNR